MVRSHGRRTGSIGTTAIDGDAQIEDLDVTNQFAAPTISSGDTVTLPNNPDVIPVYVDAATGDLLVPDLE